MKNILLLAFTIAFVVVPSVSAQQNRGTLNELGNSHQGVARPIVAGQKNATGNSSANDTNITALKNRADTLISTRLTALSTLLTRIQDDKRLSGADKTTLTTQVQQAISGLNTLKTTIDNDTTVQQVRDDSKKIFTDYRVFAYFEPEIRLSIVLDNIDTTTSSISGVLDRVQTYLDSLKTSGTDTTASQVLLDDAKAQVASISGQVSADRTALTGINITTADPHATFVKIRQDIAGVREEFTKIKQDILDIRHLLVKDNSTPESSSPAQENSGTTPTTTTTP